MSGWTVLVVGLGLLPFVAYVPLMRRTGRAVVTGDSVTLIGGVRIGARRMTWPVGSYELTPQVMTLRIRRWLTAPPSELTIERELLSHVSVAALQKPFTRGVTFIHPTAGVVEILPGNPRDFHRYWTEFGWPAPA